MISRDPEPLAAPLTPEQRAWTLAVVISLGFMARMLTFHMPLLDHHSWRQADGAMIARNFYRTGIAPLHPQSDARGAQPDGYVATGLELHAVVFAAVARVAGFAPQIGRAVSALCFPFSALLLWGFVRTRYGEWHGVLALIVYALGLPLVLFAERAVWNEPFLLLFSLAALRAGQLYLARKHAAALIALIAAVAAIGAVKPQWLIVLAPVAALWMEAEGGRGLFRLALLAVVAAALVSAGAMLWHMRTVAALPHALDFGAADKLFSVDDMNGHYVYVVLRRLFRDILGPVGLVAWLTGIVVSVRRGRLVEAAAFAGFIAYLIIVSRGNRAHDYYLLAVVPGALISIPEGIVAIARALARAAAGRMVLRAQPVAFVLVWTMALFCFGRSISFHSWYEVDSDKEYFCSALPPMLRPGELVVFANYNSPDLLYCLDHRGWLLLEGASTPETLSRLTAEGASVLVMPLPGPPGLAPASPPLLATERWVAYRLK